MRNQGVRRVVLFIAASLSALAGVPRADAGPATWYVSPRGNDAWSGRLAEPNAAKSDGPFATLERARDEIRHEKAGGALPGAALVLIRGGDYYLSRPFTLEPQDSGTAGGPVVYAAYPGERPTISGGRPITGWNRGQGNLWQVKIPEVRAGAWYFHELFVNGQRRDRARLPREGYFRAVGPLVDYPHRRDPFGGNREIHIGFKFKPGELKSGWRNLADVNVFLYHSWTNSLHWIDTVDDAGTVRFTNPAQWPVGWWEREQRYWVDNVREALDAPGQWYLDRKTGLLEYYPLPGEDMARASCVAPMLPALVKFDGAWEEGRLVHDVLLRGLALEHADWSFDDRRRQLDGQSAEFLGAAVLARGAERVGIENCEIAHLGEYGLWFSAGCKNNRIVHCEIHDLGGGGVRIGETTRRPAKLKQPQPGSATAVEGTGPRDTGHNTIDNNFIHDGGHVFAAGTGVFLGHSAYNQITHNEICDFFYSGICAGWVWGYAPSPSHHNRIADNHIHHLGWGVLSDMGGVYTLGQQPGTVVAHNLVHHVNAYSYGGWGLYTDEGSSDIVLENNVVYDTKTGGFHQHYGANNVIRNNIFAFSREMQIVRSREDLKNSLTLLHNIVYCDNDQVLTRVWRNGDYHVDYNDYWTTAAAVPLFDGRDFDQWRATSGQDRHSILADPRFVDAGRRNFQLQPGSPALALGFRPIALSGFGLYGEPGWIDRPKKVVRGEFVLPPTAAPTPTGIDDGFENTPVGSKAENATTLGEEKGASIRVSDEAAAAGKHSLKFVDAEGMAHSFDPHMFYSRLHCLPGIARGSFDIRLGPGCLVSHEWRDNDKPYHAGPSLRFEADGELSSGRTKLLRLPLGQWIHVEITCGLGDAAGGSFDLSVTVPGQRPRHFANLPLMSKDFRRLQWFGFSSNATKKVEFYVDNVKLVTGEKAPARPNIVFILCDDLGYGDVRCNNPDGKIATPNIDRLAAAGMRFSDAHGTSAVCTPTRYSVLTGRYNWRTRLQSGVLGGTSPRLIEPGRLTVAEMLRRQGYHTACIGKWHLGMDWPRKPGRAAFDDDVEKGPEGWNIDFTKPIANGPNSVGFDYYFGISASLDMVPYTFIENDRVTALPTVEKAFPMMFGKPRPATRPGPGAAGFEAVDVLPTLTRKAVEYIAGRAAEARAGKPFFLYLPLNAPHTPIAPTPEWQGRSGLNPYGDFVMETDACVGQVLRVLDAEGLTGNTLLFFTSDNGCSPSADFPALLAKGHNPSYILRGYKADIWDGGHRVPFIVRWPGEVRPGSVSDQLVSLMDLTATCADVVGVKLPDNAAEDSVSIRPALVGRAAGPLREALVSHSVFGKFCIRQGPWKLELCPGSGGWSAPRDPQAVKQGLPDIQLYDMTADIRERRNLQAEHPEIVRRLTALLEKYVAQGRSTPGAPQKNAVTIDLWKDGKAARARKRPEGD